MAQISKYPVDKIVYEQIFDVFSKTIASLSTKKQVYLFFEEFLSSTEKIMLTKRLAIGLLIAKDYDYWEISRTLKVSTSTIREFKALYKENGSYNKVIKSILADEKIENFFLDLGEKITSVGNLGGKGSGAWRYLNKEIKNRKNGKVL